VADHALAAASDGRADAAPLGVAFGFAAGERLVRMFDRDAARTILQRSLQAWRRLEAPLAAAFDASRAWRILGDLELAAGDQGAAVDAYRGSERVARDASELATAYASHSHMPYRHGDFDATLAILDEAERRLPADAEVALARIRTETAWCLARVRRFAEALPLAEWALEALLANGDRPGSMRALDVFGMVLTYVGRRDEGIERIEQSLALALELQDPMWEVRARLHVGLLLVRSGRAARARPHFERGTELAALTGDLYGQATSEWGAAEMEHQLGDLAAAAAHRRREIELLQALGGNPHNEAMSHAHLAHLARVAGDVEAERTHAAAARRLATPSPEAGYVDRIERALAADDWATLET
jgi:tetratricopeptide (TPR) repeat protein